jgi:hypothetical protein
VHDLAQVDDQIMRFAGHGTKEVLAKLPTYPILSDDNGDCRYW